MAKKIVQQQNTDPIDIGIDIGYGVTKAIMNGSPTPVLFPSVCGHAREIKFRAEELANKYPGDQITDDDGSWFVGDLAMSQLSTGGLLRLRGRTANEAEVGNVFRIRMMCAALGKLLPGKRNGDVVQVRIATGLPVDHIRSSPELKAALLGQHRVYTDQSDFIVSVTEVMVMPQPYGIIYANMLTEAGELNPCHIATRTGVVDIGTYTIDVAVDDDGEYIDVESGSLEFGISTAQDAIAAMFERDHGQKPKYKVVESILKTGCAKVGGETFDYTQEVNDALEPVRSATTNLMAEKWQAGKGIDVIYLGGGGAELVEQAVKAAGYKQAAISQNAQLSIAQGYLNYALFSRA